MKISRDSLRIVLSIILVLASACATRPKTSSVFLSSLKKQVIRSLQNRETIATSLRATVSFRSTHRKNPVEVFLLVKRPLDFRFDVMSDFGYYLQQASSLAGLFTVIWYEENRYFRGAGTAEQLREHLSIGLSPDDVVRFLLGSLPLEEEGDYELSPLRKKEHYLLRGQRSEITVRKAGAEYLPIKYVALNLDRASLYSIEYDNYSSESLFPYRIRGQFRGKRMEITFDEIELNPVLSRDLFEIEVPEGADRIYE